ncbi:MAG: GNAT family N-acetyltransferase [Calditrichia bacterium]|nr:GNAT family N-acetyltransferase [Calditrichia bacterium]
MKNPFIIGDKIYLRAPEEGDEKIIAITENHPDARETLFYALPVSLDSIRDKWNKFRDDPNTIVFIICSKNPDKHVGITAFHRIDWVGRMAIFYIAIADMENRSKGFGTEATELLANYAFTTLNLNRIQLHVAVKNEKAIKVYKKAGYEIEGTLRQAMYWDGKYHDFYVMGLLKKDYNKK